MSMVPARIRRLLCMAITTATLVVSSCAAHRPVSETRFVVFGDSQFTHQDTFDRFVHEAELLKPDFALHVGDMIHGYTYDPRSARRQWAKFRSQLAPLSMPFYPTPGNHDVTTTEILAVYREQWPPGKPLLPAGQQPAPEDTPPRTGSLSYSFSSGDNRVIVLDVVSPPDMYKLTEEDFAFLQTELERWKNTDNIFVSFHDPIHLRDPKEFDWEPVHQLLKRYPVRAVFTGHNHVYDHRVRDGIHYFCLNSSGLMNYKNHLAGFSHDFLFVTARGAEVSFAVVTEDGIYPADAVASDERERSSKFFEAEKTILISSPLEHPVNTEVAVTIRNRAAEDRDYRVEWQTNDFAWSFEPQGMAFALAGGEERELTFRIRGPQGKFKRSDLPRLRVMSPYITNTGRATTIDYVYQVFFPPRVEATFLPDEGDIQLDGIPDEFAWSRTGTIEDFFIDTEGTPAPEKTIVRMLYGPEHLYVSIVGEEPNPEGLAAFAHGKTPLVFGDDDFELFFDPQRDFKTYYRLMTNPKGTQFNSGPKGLFTVEYDVATHVGQTTWGAEFRIPYTSLAVETPKSGDTWGLNVRRHRQQADPAQRDWSKMNNFPPQLVYFGLLRFD